MFFFALFNLSSCTNNNEPIDPALNLNLNNGGGSTATTGILKVDFDGKTFVATTVQALLNESYISISGLRAPNGDFVQITLLSPYNKVGTYTWGSVSQTSGVLGLVYSASNGAVAYVSDQKSSGGASNFPNYTDTASITISKIDTANKTISGTFQFTGVKYSDLSGNTIDTKVLTNGSFTNVSYAADTTAPTGNTFSAKLDGVTFNPTNTTAFASSGNIAIVGRRGSIENISFNLPNNITPGTYNLDSFSTYIGVYTKDASSTGIFGVDVGTIKITSHNTVTKKIAGTFSFSSNSLFSTEKHNITDGTFSVSY